VTERRGATSTYNTHPHSSGLELGKAQKLHNEAMGALFGDRNVQAINLTLSTQSKQRAENL
jgi:hypothetical protein